ncbi:MAG: hypothetical protein HY872_03660 [Chloroflexi bacterium]|nr:hypothetical protein [Chloroflexota bacterium]
MSQLTEANPYDSVEHALRTYPPAPAPPTLAPGVLARIRAERPAARFSIGWLDITMSVFGAAMVFVCGLLWVSIPAQWSAQAALEVLWLRQWIGPIATLWPILAGALALAATSLLLAVALFAPVGQRHGR